MSILAGASRGRLLASTFVLSTLAAASAISGCGDDEEATTGAGGGGATAASTSTGAGGDPACVVEHLPEDDAAPPPVFTPRWALRPWISKDISDGPDTYAFVEGFQERDIPVAVVVLDSPWETSYNTFEPSPTRYPEFGQMVADLRERGVRTVLWTTQMLNFNSFDAEQGGDLYVGPADGYERADDCDWFVNDGQLNPWWKGRGGAIDFFDPVACDFFHRTQDRVLDLGIAGWKLDFGEQYIEPADPMVTDGGEKSRQEYSEAYYEDFYAYGAAKLGTDEFVTMVRPYDRSYGFEGRFFARPEHAPVAWVGDNRRDDIGLADAMDHIFRSARAGYAVVGSDIGGYLNLDDEDLAGGGTIPADASNFQRWTAVATFHPFFQLHGRANLAPWTFPDAEEEVTASYREDALLHDALVPFFDALTRAAYAGGAMPIRPIGEEADWAGDYRFTLGDAILVAPALDGSGSREVELPAGRMYFDLWDTSAVPLEGGTTIAVDTTTLAHAPAWLMDGAIIPAFAHRDAPVLGDPHLEGLGTVLIVPGRDASLGLFAEDGTPSQLDMTDDGDEIAVSLDVVTEATVLRIRTLAAPDGVEADGAALEEGTSRADLAATPGSFLADDAAGEVLVHLGEGGAVTVRVARP